MKLKVSYNHLVVIVRSIQNADKIEFETEFERQITKAILTELEEMLLVKLIKKKEKYGIELKGYQLITIQLTLMWYNTEDKYDNSVSRQLIEQTDKLLIQLNLK